MGHCAPTVTQTLLDASDAEAPWLVKLTAGLPGGIGNTGGECGGVTAPLILFGLRHAHDPARKWFETEFGSTQCRTLAGCNFASVAEVNGFIEGDGVARCEALATRVAERVRAVMDEAHAAPPQAESSRVPVTRA